MVAVAALLLWPRPDPQELTHTHDVAITDDQHLDDATAIAGGRMQHIHIFVIDQDHLRWPQPHT